MPGIPELRFYYQLCRELGGMTVGEMLERISSEEITYWYALYLLEEEERPAKE